MSKIYKALEKAERERGMVKTLSPVAGEAEGEIEKKEKEILFSQVETEKIYDERLVALSQKTSLPSEQFRKLRTQILKMKIPDPPRTIMVTSSTNNEGKTLIAANLAIGIANHFNIHALLVDCDLRNPQIEKLFGLESRKGLSDYLLGDGDLSQYFLKTSIEKLLILPGGSAQENPAEILDSKKMELLVEELKSRYNDRFIIFDTTPILATSEPGILSKIVDGVLLVVRGGVTPRETVEQAISNIENNKILGFVLNDVKFRSSSLFSRYFGSDGYYYRYGYGYGYRTKKVKEEDMGFLNNIKRFKKIFDRTKNSKSTF